MFIKSSPIELIEDQRRRKKKLTIGTQNPRTLIPLSLIRRFDYTNVIQIHNNIRIAIHSLFFPE